MDNHLFWQYFQYIRFPSNKTELIWGTDLYSIIYVTILQLLLIFYIIKCSISHSKEDFSFLSKFSKFIMIAGILSIAIFTYNYIN